MCDLRPPSSRRGPRRTPGRHPSTGSGSTTAATIGGLALIVCGIAIVMRPAQPAERPAFEPPPAAAPAAVAAGE